MRGWVSANAVLAGETRTTSVWRNSARAKRACREDAQGRCYDQVISVLTEEQDVSDADRRNGKNEVSDDGAVVGRAWEPCDCEYDEEQHDGPERVLVVQERERAEK